MSKQTTPELLAELISFPTVSRESNLALVSFVQDYLVRSGVECELFFNQGHTKASLFATIGPRGQSGIVLSGHTDVVPANEQGWTTDPFAMTERDGRFYGRGTADMKGFIAAVLAAVPALTRRPLRVPVHIALSYDEEVGCLGVRPMLAEIAKRIPLPAMCVIGEPTEMRPILGHKGKLAVRCCVKGHACHSAYSPSGVNAIEYAARLITRLAEIGERLAQPGYQDAAFVPPFSTIQTGTVSGGRALNIVPDECQFDFEVRAIPGLDPVAVQTELNGYAQNELLPRMRAVHPGANIELQELSSYPALSTHPDNSAAKLLAILCDSQEFGTVAFGSEGGLYSQAGIPTVICGPGSMEQGHKPNEFIASVQLKECDSMLERLIEHVRQ